MGRSKFPGKPSKHVNRTRVNVLPPPTGTTTVGDSNTVVTVETGSDLKKANDTSNAAPGLASTVDSKMKNRLARKKQRLPGKCGSGRRKSLIGAASNRNKKSKLNGVSAKHTSKVAARRSVRGFSAIRKLPKPKHALGATIKESNNLVGKFVLPSRSVHSSRVIKPNKRFITVESEARTFKKRVINKRQAVKVDENKCVTVVASESKEDVSPESDNVENRTSCTNGKVVLRQARLQLHNQNPTGPEGPFSSGSSNTSNPPGTVTCGVCGAVRFYRFVKQARKFNIYSCESCRKFISKMIKRHSNKNLNTTTLVCHKGQGMCHVPPIVRSQQWKLIWCAYRARCPACWLKMCLRSFQMPTTLKNSLTQLLPKNMQTCDTLFSSSLPLLSWQSAVENKSALVANNESKTNSIRPRPLRLKSVRKDEKPAAVPVPSDIKRQKLDLKGPRVKHVCRSASIVLGQPLAIFPDIKKGDQEPIKNSVKNSESKSETRLGEEISMDNQNVSEDKENKAQPVVEMKTALAAPIKIQASKVEHTSSYIPKREKFSKSLSSRFNTLETKSYKKINDITNSISIDFWETYDPEEVCCSGFSLIGSEPFPMQAICFLCGSAGKDALLHCSLCCEPYHTYCLEQTPSNINSTSQLTWLCPRCTTCNACGHPDKQKINCQKCHKAYHPECFNVKWNVNDKPTVCSNCSKCKNCSADNITKLVGNLALCVDCFKLRNKGHFCPLCQSSYDENDINAKMMECRKCNKWIHAKCEGLLDEQYEVLSFLPESVEFLCRLCSVQSTPHWRKAVHSELRTSFNTVLRMLTKNQTVRSTLKWSPLQAARKIQFSENEAVTDQDMTTDLLDIPPKCGPRDSTKNSGKYDVGILGDSALQSKAPISPIMLHIKNKLNSNEHISLKEFNMGMEQALTGVSTDLLAIYRSIFKKVFPWYDPLKNEDVTADKSLCDAPTTEETICDLQKFPSFDYRKNMPLDKDTRICSLCKIIGDGLPHEEGRLLYCGQNEWLHANCALWSSEVYEEIDGSLQNVQSAISRARSIRCVHCKHKGASVGCCCKGCHETYHFRCAQEAQCQFLHDKTLYCSTHDLSDKNSLLSNLGDFDIRRPVYIELDKKKKKYSEPNKIHFMVGSLSVTSLGKIVPTLSDGFEAIIPSGFTCSRLFWSTEEPWKLIPYVIKTSVLNAHIGNIFVDKNFTIDHSLSKIVVEKKLKELITWQKELEKERSECVESDDDDEPQNAADILSPELTDAILEELPHDLLDGISVQDMLMSYEELFNMDFRTSEMNDNVNLNISADQKKESEYEGDTEKTTRELKRSKSEILSQLGSVDKMSKVKNHQRSCSLTWSCKLDNSLTPVSKKRKITSRENNMFFQLLQVDGGCESSGSECGSPVHEMEDMWTPAGSEEPVTCEKCQCTYRTIASYKRHLETCDAMFTSESDSEEQAGSLCMNGVENNSILVTVGEAEPRVITAYESFSTYQSTQNEVHSTILNTQTFLSSKSTSEVVAVPENNGLFYPAFQQVVEQKAITQPSITIGQTGAMTISQPTLTLSQANLPTPMETAPITINNHAQPGSYCVNQHPLSINQSSSFSLNQSSIISVENGQPSYQPINQPLTINQGSISVNQPMNHPVEIQPQQVTIQSVPYSHEIAPILNIAPQNQITIDGKMISAAPNIVNSMVAQSVLPQSQWVKPAMKSVITQKAIRSRAKPRLAAKRTRVHTGETVVVSQGGATTAPSMIFQHLPSTNIMPRFLDSFQQQNGQNLQYVATIAPQINSTIAPQTQLVQFQPDNNFLSLVPGVQPTTMIIQPRMVADQLIVDSSGSVVWATQPVQPLYYGFETIVQNTVLQSSQFLPTTMPGVLTTNSSYSATTQVFQTSKLEPVLDVSQGGFVLLNSGQILNQQLPQPIAQNVQNHISAVPVQNNKQNTWKYVESNPVPEVQATSIMPIAQAQPKPPVAPTIVNPNSITLPIAPFIQEQGIPTNIVTPTPKAPSMAQSRPMSRVLPMQTNLRENKKIVEIKPPPLPLEKELALLDVEQKLEANDKIQKVVIREDVFKQETSEIISNKLDSDLLKVDQPLKLVFQKQSQDGLYKISNNYTTKNASVPIAPLKPIKPKLENLKEIAEFKVETIIVPTEQPKQQAKSSEASSAATESKLAGNKQEPQATALLYTVETQDGFRFSSTSLGDLWTKIFEAVQAARMSHNMAPLPTNGLHMINNLQLLGLKSNGLKYLIEQLPGANKCTKYKPSFSVPSTYEDAEEDLVIGHTHGAIRCVPYVCKKEPNDMFGWLASKHRKVENCLIDSDLLPRRGSVTNLPMAMRFRQLKVTSKVSVGVFRSGIHRRGLFSLRDIESGEMVIEYAGEVIRSILTDKREKHYNSKGIGCYMFRIDDNLVVDATMKGNAARFINHSCDPNCFSKVVEIHGHKHIIIFALRKILCGEELTYDYKFPFEEDKIPCTCGAKRCRKFLN